MKILIVGGGGREHALAWKCAQSPLVDHVFVAPGNAGTALEPNVSNVDVAAEDSNALLKFAEIDGDCVWTTNALSPTTFTFSSSALRLFESFSTKSADFAPRDSASKPRAPEPA